MPDHPDFHQLANAPIRTLLPYQPGKPVEELARELGIHTAVKLASNENPLGASEQALAAAQRALAQANSYPDGSCYMLKQTLARFLGVDASQLTIGNGSENILELIVKSYLQPGDNAVIAEYTFLAIPLLLKSYGVSVRVAPAKDWTTDIAGMLAAINDQTRVLFLVNPNNPTGTHTTAADFAWLMREVPPQVLVVVDEAYAEYIHNADYPQTLAALPQYPNLVITRTFSKIYGLAALRLGYAISSPVIADILNRARMPFNVNAIAAAAAEAAIADQAHVARSRESNASGRQQLEAALHAMGLPFIPSSGNFIAIDVADAGAVYQQLLLEGVIVRALQSYDMPRHIRVTIGTADQNERFLLSLDKVSEPCREPCVT